MKEFTQEHAINVLDRRIGVYYNQWKRGMKAAYDEMNALQEFRKEITGEMLHLNMSIKPEGSQRVIF